MTNLRFIHITKTGGVSIEKCGLENGIRWGVNDKEYGWEHEIFINKPAKLKSKYKWFTVVRNPYTRIVSEFHCFWGRRHRGFFQKTEFAIKFKDTALFNSILLDQIRHGLDARSQDGKVGDHYTPQHLYIDPSADIRILKFENLAEEFDQLMAEYGVLKKNGEPLTLSKHENKGKKTFTESDLSPEVIAAINNFYSQDFIKFNYSTISP